MALVVTVDTGKAGDMIRLAGTAVNWQHSIDVWINNAGVLGAGDFDMQPSRQEFHVLFPEIFQSTLPPYQWAKMGISIYGKSLRKSWIKLQLQRPFNGAFWNILRYNVDIPESLINVFRN